MKIKTSELIGAHLDWAVAKAAEIPTGVMSGILYRKDLSGDTYGPGPIFKPSTDWSQGGPLIERFGIMLVNPESDGGDWEASPQDNPEWQDGGTPLIAACRAIVMDKFGEEIEVPEELV